MKIVAFIALALAVSSAQAANNNFECFAPGQEADVFLFTRDLRVFSLVQAGKTTKLKLDRKKIRLEPTRLAFEVDDVRFELTFETENSNRADGVLTGLADTEAPVHWVCARQLYGP